MKMAEEQRKLDFIKNKLPKLIIDRNEELKNNSVVKCEVNSKSQIDGFMAQICYVNLTLKDADGKLVKFRFFLSYLIL